MLSQSENYQPNVRMYDLENNVTYFFYEKNHLHPTVQYLILDINMRLKYGKLVAFETVLQ